MLEGEEARTVVPEAEVRQIVDSYLLGINFVFSDSSRDAKFWDNHLLSYLAQDFMESAVSIFHLVRIGTVSVARREIRFIIESSVKVCYVQQKNYNSSIKDKLAEFNKELSSSKISIKDALVLDMLPKELHDDFDGEVGRLYGRTSEYVHLTPQQIQERITARDAIGVEQTPRPMGFGAFSDLLSRGLASSLVFLFHSVPTHVTGDFIVPSDGGLIDWYFTGSRFIAGIDSYFDYKCERQKILDEIRAARAKKIRF